MTEPNSLLNQAKSGNAQAIATIINKTLEPKGISVKSSISYDCLTLILESNTAPAQEATVDFIKKGLLKLQPNNITKVIIRGRIKNQSLNLWQESFNLIEPQTIDSLSHSVQTSKTNEVAATKETHHNPKKYSYHLKSKKSKSKEFSELTISEIIQLIVDFIKTKNGERLSLVLVTFVGTSIFWNIVNPDNHQGSSSSTASSSNSIIPAIPFIKSKYTIKGSITLIDSDIKGADDSCYGTGGYRDIQANMPVTIKDGQGNILATGKTGSGKKDSRVVCVFDFEINDIPKVDFYSIEVGRRGQLNYSFQELEEKEWTVSLSLGT
ncbi:hypothetical protein K4A83_12805 [Spirulina subsalsa FACHB-351]|uniref:Uncharacterized protein n=1 Tax=Spirulina subsalsa FACHB-351 TaxID=234711 RepID=A0ABT3L6R6_9CYAN|nr:hypothetical protein [Spirulina subsalsa]MCW6037142.1 hypothetical protein [Spirulina subsalsa FACHB-351]